MAAAGTQLCTGINRGPLTTTFTPPSTCLGTTSAFLAGFQAPPSNQHTVYYVGLWTPALPDYVTDYTGDSCVPQATGAISLEGPWYFSPGICPSGYSPAAPLSTVPSNCDQTVALAESITAWACCPSGYSINAALTDVDWLTNNLCISTAPGAATLTNVWPISWVSEAGDFASLSTWPISPPSGIVESTVVITNPTVIAEAIPVMWQSTDTQVQSWFDSHQASGSLSVTDSGGSSATASPSPTQSATTASATSTQSSSTWDHSRSSERSVAALVAMTLIVAILAC
ncbi:hypothetical protein BX600DRAFT_467539 [Xylariales sp. PMI_506]|nr:hypothetical protein BX600DRAFT_467539 [Xylariales sp. PMI_506]